MWESGNCHTCGGDVVLEHLKDCEKMESVSVEKLFWMSDIVSSMLGKMNVMVYSAVDDFVCSPHSLLFHLGLDGILTCRRSD